jgi:hypothetical protein
MLVRGIERRSRTITSTATRLALLTTDVFQLVLEDLAWRCRWAAVLYALLSWTV